VEAEAVKRGIPASTLDTFSFQAEGFYLKQGYKHLGTIKNYLEGHDRIYLRKQL
ncbi:N-acetyltransferase, partial [Legionella pneumophila]